MSGIEPAMACREIKLAAQFPGKAITHQRKRARTRTADSVIGEGVRCCDLL